ncbi:MAG: cell division protein FtsL [Gammaproteobacteria bacterium]|nr:MAG: cell division protein FtsL [Gammaproteobacteria bacterium]
MKSVIILGSLVIFLGIGAVQVAESRYHARQLMSEIRSIKSDTDKMRLEWSQLILESAMLTNENTVYQFAEGRLNMTLPRAQEVVYRQPN